MNNTAAQQFPESAYEVGQKLVHVERQKELKILEKNWINKNKKKEDVYQWLYNCQYKDGRYVRYYENRLHEECRRL